VDAGRQTEMIEGGDEAAARIADYLTEAKVI
jgi:hypothetical protein